MKMSVTRALAELKTLDKRISKKIENLEIIRVVRKGSIKSGDFDTKEFSNSANAQLQSVRDLIERKSEIKSKVMQSNATTKVTIGTKEMTVAEAICMKDTIEQWKYLNTRLMSAKASANTTLERVENVAERDLNNQLNVVLGSDREDSSAQVVELERLARESNWPTLVDPTNIADVCEELTSNIDEFTTNVDFSLSEINAKTEIEIND